jgi:hypothetical protein
MWASNLMLQCKGPSQPLVLAEGLSRVPKLHPRAGCLLVDEYGIAQGTAYTLLDLQFLHKDAIFLHSTHTSLPLQISIFVMKLNGTR